MAHFQVFIPDKKGSDPQHLVDVGLADLVDRAEFFDVRRGPEGNGGLGVGWRPDNPKQRLGFYADEQNWAPSVPSGEFPAGRYWVGFWNESPPTPGNMLRDYAYRGPRLTLGDGNEWQIPEARELPQTMVLADDGTWKFEVQRRFYKFFDDCQAWTDRLQDADEQTTIAFIEAADFTVRSLSLNYRLTPEVVSHLGLFTTTNVLECLFAPLGILADAKALTS